MREDHICLPHQPMTRRTAAAAVLKGIGTFLGSILFARVATASAVGDLPPKLKVSPSYFLMTGSEVSELQAMVDSQLVPYLEKLRADLADNIDGFEYNRRRSIVASTARRLVDFDVEWKKRRLAILEKYQRNMASLNESHKQGA